MWNREPDNYENETAQSKTYIHGMWHFKYLLQCLGFDSVNFSDYDLLLRISWTGKKLDKTVLREADTTRSLIYIEYVNARQVFLGQETRREKLEHLVTTGMIETKTLDGITKSLTRQKE